MEMLISINFTLFKFFNTIATSFTIAMYECYTSHKVDNGNR